MKWAFIAVIACIVVTALPVLLMRWWNPFSSAFMLNASVVHASEKNYTTRYQWVDYEKISPNAAIAVVAAEDQHFPFHDGFDFESIRDAMEENATRKRPRGASTISQQVAKNLFLWNGGGYVRKGLEAWMTVLIEFLWPKERILEVYLNIAQFGRGVYGVEAASRTYFRKPASRLTQAEAATLAAVLPNPIRLRANKPSRYVQSRRDWIIGQMRGLGGSQYLKAEAPPPKAR